MSVAIGPLGRNGEALGSLNTSGKVAAMSVGHSISHASIVLHAIAGTAIPELEVFSEECPSKAPSLLSDRMRIRMPTTQTSRPRSCSVVRSIHQIGHLSSSTHSTHVLVYLEHARCQQRAGIRRHITLEVLQVPKSRNPRCSHSCERSQNQYLPHFPHHPGVNRKTQDHILTTTWRGRPTLHRLQIQTGFRNKVGRPRKILKHNLKHTSYPKRLVRQSLAGPTTPRVSDSSPQQRGIAAPINPGRLVCHPTQVDSPTPFLSLNPANPWVPPTQDRS